MSNLVQLYKGGDEQRREGYWLSFGYNLELVEEIKKQIPHTHRVWDDKKKQWWVSMEYEDVLTKLFTNFHALAHLQGRLI